MQSYTKHTDEELVHMVREDGEGAFREIYNRYWDKLFNAAYKRVKDIAFCEETVQQLFTTLWLKRSSLTFSAGLSNYLFSAVRYGVIDHYRKHVIRESFVHSRQADHNEDNCTQEAVLLNDLKNHIAKLVDGLPDKPKKVYQMSRLDYKSNKEIARLLDISEKTVEGHLTKALSHLRANIGDYLPLFLLLISGY